MPGYFAALTIVLLLVMVLTRVLRFVIEALLHETNDVRELTIKVEP